MDIKIKHRILGFLVIASLVVILLPFFQKSKIISPEIAVKKMPAFPDHVVEMASVNAPAVPTSFTLEKATPDETISVAETAKQSTKIAALEKQPVLNALPTPVIEPFSLEDKNGLFKLKRPTWLVQVGRFQNKASAIRLARSLKRNGYHPLMQQYGAEGGTHLFVAPENTASSAHFVAQELENKMHVHGVVIYYKPLA
ncbi:MAG: hypothetical protein A3F43_05740 [Gammaproteobacteria bacterium RIFCSPHIGHO2_12_FULL_42_10]|nr:MAG: hypothetical protein A3F43_05740 [Gammaproteobacteria bacterium RIFCSPHIGHO2_12_FULL_42_10]